MKKILKLTFLLFIGISTKTFAQNQNCEDKWSVVKRINTNDNWKEKNTISSGKVFWKTIEYNGDYAYQLYKDATSGYYFFGNSYSGTDTYYNNERDAIRALFIWSNCSGYFSEQGKVK